MDITLNTKDLVKALTIGGCFANKSKIMPILDCVKIECGEGFIRIYSSDTENSIGKRVSDVEVKELGDVCIDYKSLISYIKLIKDDCVHISTQGNGFLATISHSKGELELPIMDASEFPLPSDLNDVEYVNFDAKIMLQCIQESKDFIYHDNLRPQFMGINMVASDNKVDFASTDTIMMYLNTFNVETKNEFNAIIPNGAIKPLMDMLRDASNVKIRKNEGLIEFTCQGTRLVARMYNGNFPDCKRIIPKNNSKKVIVNKIEFIETLNRASVASTRTPLIKLELDGSDCMWVEAQDIDFSLKGREHINCKYNGDFGSSTMIGLDANKFITCLNAINSENVELAIESGTKPMLIKDLDDIEKVIILMPMAL